MHQPRRRVALVAALLGLSLLSCGREVTGPEDGFPYGRERMAELALAPEFPALPGASLASDVEPFERVRVTLLRTDGTVAKDTLIDFPSTADSLALALVVPLPLTAPDSGVTMSLALRYVNAAGDTVFRGGPIPVRVRGAQGGQPAPPVVIPVTWEPNGPVPASVVLLPDSGTAVAGGTTTFTATALDAGGQPIPGAPILFTSLDTARARVQAPGSGQVTWRAVRGPASIAAFALNGVSDTARFTIALPPALVLPVTGTTQGAPVRQPLAAPVELRVTAADSVPVAGVRVDFAVATGGGSLTALADTSDANGLVSTNWTLGSALGAQTITATIAGVATSARTITATATEAVPAQLVVVSPPTSGVAGVATPDVVVHVRDATGTTIGTFADTVVGSIVFGPPGQPIPARRRVQAAAGVATFTAPSFELAGRYVIEFSYGALAPVLSDTFTVTAAAAAQLLRDGTSGDGQAGLPGAALAQPLRVRVADAFGNAVAGTVVTWATTGGALASPTSTSAADGYAANTLTLPSVAGAVQVTATAPGLAGSPQVFGLTVSAGAPTQLALVSTFPALTAGQVIPDVIVHARDAAGNLAPAYNGLVFARILTGPNGPDTDSVTVTAVNGVATITGQSFDRAGTYTVRFNAPGLTDAVSPPITVTAAAATQLVVVSFPDSVTTGAAMLPFVVEARDPFGNVDPTFTGTVTASITTGPTGAPIAGTLARTAVAGVATFDDLQLTLVGPYRLAFTAGALTPTFADLVAWLGAPAGLAIVAGDAQTAPAFETLGDSIAVRVTDLGGNPVPGVLTSWNVVTGGGSLSSPTAVTGADGRAAVRWTLGGTVGGQSVNASAGVLGPVTFVATATAALPSVTWTGAASTAWDNPANWSPARVPTATDSVYFPAAAAQMPVVTVQPEVRALVNDNAAPITMSGGNWLYVRQRLVLRPDVAGIACGTGSVVASPLAPLDTTRVQGRLDCSVRHEFGTVVLTDSMVTTGPLTWLSGSVRLAPAGRTLRTTHLLVGDAAALVMTNAADTVVADSATFNGAPTTGLLTAGVLRMRGGFYSGANTESFAASGAHVTQFEGAVDQSIFFATPGTNAGQSHFHTLAIGQPLPTTSITLRTDAYATGALRNGPGPQKFLTAPVTVVLSTAGAEYGGAAFDNVRWELLDGAPVTGILGGFTFSNMPTGQPQLHIARTGGTIQFTGVTFDVVPATGAFLQAEDLDGAANGVLTVSMTATTPGFHAGRAVLLGGAQLLGWPLGPSFTWTGATSAGWTDAANWSDGIVPTGADSVHIPAGTPFSPLIAADTAVRALTLAAGATLDHEGVNLTVYGSVDVGLGGSISGAGGRLNLYGTGAHTLRGAMGAVRIDGGSYALAGGVQVSGLVDVYNGDLSIGGFGLVSTGSLYVGIDGTLTMTDPAGVADFAGTVSFNGTSTAGRLTAGLLRVAGDFEQLSSSGGLEDLSFAASGTHVVELVGGATQVIRFDTPDSSASATCATSCFASLHASKTGGGIRFRTSAKALGDLDLSLPGDSVSAISAAGVPTHLVAGGAARFTAPVLRAGSIAWRDTVATTATTIQVDSLVAWGSDTLLVGLDSVRTVMLGDYRLRGTLAGDLEARAQLDVDGAARVAGSLYTRGPGTLRMTEPTDTIVVLGVSDFGGGATAGLLTAGAYRAGNIFRTTSSGAFAAGGAHRTFFDNLCGLCDGYTLQVADSLSRFQWLDITGGNWTIQPASAPVVVNDNLEVRSVLQGNPFVRVGGGFYLYGTAQTDLQHLSVAGTVALRSGFLADTLTFAGPAQSLNTTGTDGAQINYQHVEIRGTVLASPHPTVITSIGSLTVNGGDLLVGSVTDTDSTRLQVAGLLGTSNGGRLGMQSDLAWISTGSNATFAGGSTENLITAGRLTIGGNFAQSGDPASFAAGGTHVTQFSTEGLQSIGFTASGAGVGTSHFQHLEIAQAPSSRVDLLSPVVALGQLRAAHAWETRLRADVPRTLTAGGANLQDVRFDRVALALVDGEAIEGMDQLTFDSLPPTATQLRLDRAGGAVLLGQPEFVVAPTGAGRFIVADDAVVNGDPLTITVDTPLPAAHGGFITQAGEAVITGWNASALVTWTGAGTLYAWNDPANWDAGRVPGFADDVVIPGAAPVSPIINGPETIVVRSLTNQHNTALIVTGDLIVRGSFLNPWAAEASVSCDGGTVGFVIDPDSIGEISGAMGNCDVAMTSGTLRVADSTNVRLMAVGGGLLDINGRRMRVSQDFTTTGSGRLRMMTPDDTLDIAGDAFFAGEGIAATMMDGLLRVGGDFTQLSLTNASSFRSQGTRVDFVGPGTSNVSIQEPGLLQSAFSGLIIAKDAGGVVNFTGAGAYAATLAVTGGTLNLNAPSVTTIAGSVNLFSQLNLFTGATLSIGAGCSGGAFFSNLGGTLIGGPCF